MRAAREMMGAILLGVLSFIIVMGGIALTLAESNLLPSLPVETIVPTNTKEVPTLSFTEPVQVQGTQAPTNTPAPTATANCPQPVGWIAITIQSGQTFDDLAQQFRISADLLAQQNCLFKETILPPGAIVYVPPVATATLRPTSIPTRCGAPPVTWVIYVVKPGDNLYRIGLAYGVTVSQLKQANCLTSDNIVSGQKLYVPNVPTRTPTFTPSPTSTLLVTPSATTVLTTQPPTTVTPETSTPVPSTATSTTVPPTATDTVPAPSNTPQVVPTATETSG